MGIIIQCHTEGDVQKARTQHWWEAIRQKEESHRETRGSH